LSYNAIAFLLILGLFVGMLLMLTLGQFLGQVTGNLVVGASTIPGEYVLPVARQLQQDVKTFGGSSAALSYAGMEGYLAARLFVEATRRTGGRGGLQEVLLRTSGWDLGGYRLDFSGGRVWGNENVGLGTRSAAGYIIN